MPDTLIAMDDSEDELLSSQSPGPVFGRIVSLSFLVPTILLSAFFAYLYFNQVPITNKIVRDSVLVVWLLTIVLITFASLRRRRVPQGESQPASIFTVSEARNPVEKWEQRNARSLLREIYLGVLVLPLVGGSLAAVVLKIFGFPLPRSDQKLIFIVAWGMGLLSAVFLSFRTREQRIGSE